MPKIYLKSTRRDGSIVLSWRNESDQRGVAFYKILRADFPTGPFITLAIVEKDKSMPLRESMYVDNTAIVDVIYWYRIIAENGTKTPIMSNIARASLKSSSGPTTLYQNYPNPFNPETFIPYQLASDSDVTIKIYDVSGKFVRTLNIGQRKAGLYIDRKKAAHWDGKNQQGERATSGIYFYQLVTDGFSTTKRMLLVK